MVLDHKFINAKSGVNNKKLQQQITDNIEFITQDNDMKSLYLSGKNKYYIVCGAGPTLVEHYYLLQQSDTCTNFTLLAVDAAELHLVNNGIMPDIIVSIDPLLKAI